MSKLDCENVSTIYESLKKISGLNPREIGKIFEDIPNEPNVYYTGSTFLHELQNKCNNINHTSTCWFHFTRNFPNEKYEDGILPLSEIIDDIWVSMYDLAKAWISSSEWLSFRSVIEDENNYSKSSELYRGKIDNSNNQNGPYGFLIFDIDCFNKPISEWHYLKDGSEVVYHICDAFQEIYKHKLFRKYITSTKPYIVKFSWPEIDMIDVGHALSALYYFENTKKLGLDDNPCFSTRGRVVPYRNIEDIFFLD